MMWEYGVGTHPKAEYQNLLGKLNVGMTFEYPLVYDNYEIIEGVMSGTPSEHAYAEWGILDALIKHASFKILGYDPPKQWYESLYAYLQDHPNTINIF